MEVEQKKVTLPDFSYLYAKPISKGDLREEMADFKVYEQLPFQASGSGEHLYEYSTFGEFVAMYILILVFDKLK